MASNIKPGTQQYGVIDPAIGETSSTTQDPFAPVEAGRTSAKSVYTTTDSSGNAIGGTFTTGAVASVDNTGTTSTKSDGTQTAAATTTTGYGQEGATITYTVASNVASGKTVVAGGSGYTVGTVLTVVGDTGVTFTVKTIS